VTSNGENKLGTSYPQPSVLTLNYTIFSPLNQFPFAIGETKRAGFKPAQIYTFSFPLLLRIVYGNLQPGCSIVIPARHDQTPQPCSLQVRGVSFPDSPPKSRAFRYLGGAGGGHPGTRAPEPQPACPAFFAGYQDWTSTSKQTITFRTHHAVLARTLGLQSPRLLKIDAPRLQLWQST